VVLPPDLPAFDDLEDLIGDLRADIDRANNQVRDAAARAELVVAVQAIIAQLRAAEDRENSVG
jgi:hypothetical protein